MKLADKYAPKKIIDQGAETIQELMPQWNVRVSRMKDIARYWVGTGEWIKVWKRVDGKLVPAYRAKKK